MDNIEQTEDMQEMEIKEPWYKGPIKYILATFLILLIVLWIIPVYAVKLDPEPKNIPKLADILPSNIQIPKNAPQDYKQLVNPEDPIIKQIADNVAAKSCSSSDVCQAKALYYFVRDNINYVADPLGKEYLEDPKEVLITSAADCESGAILLASVMEAIGIDAQLVFIESHAFVRIKLDKARAKYKIDDYVYLDWTCSSCSFGEVPYQDIKERKRVLEV